MKRYLLLAAIILPTMFGVARAQYSPPQRPNTMFTKTLTESANTSFVRVSVASGDRQGGIVYYCIDAEDATDKQTRCGSVSYTLVNKAGTETCNFGTADDSVSVSVGTLTVTWAMDTSPTNGCNLQANAVSSLTQTLLRINYSVWPSGNVTSSVVAQ